MRLARLVGLVAIAAWLTCCATSSRTAARASAPPVTPWPAAYMQAITDAMNPTPEEIVHNLVAIVRSNPQLVWKDIDGVAHVLMTTVTGNTTYYESSVGRAYDTGTHEIWVTAVPELRDKCGQPEFARGNLAMRLRQLLGLTPTSAVIAFVEFWVTPDQIFRPAADNEVTDTTAGLTMPADAEPWYRLWFNTTR